MDDGGDMRSGDIASCFMYYPTCKRLYRALRQNISLAISEREDTISATRVKHAKGKQTDIIYNAMRI